MSHIISWIQTYHTQIMTGASFVLQGIFLFLLLAVARQVWNIKRQMQAVVEQVAHYMKVVLDTEEVPEQESLGQAQAKTSGEEEENRLISAVLKEIFP
jgi:hypothetical protein